MNMRSVALGDVVEVKGGGTPSKSKPHYYTGDIPWVTPKDMKVWNISDSIDKITPEAVASSAASLIPERSVLLVNRSGILKHTLPVGITRKAVAINQDMKALLCSDRIHPEYLAHFIKAAEPIILKWVRATTADNFPIQNLKELEIPLPPLEEQKRIAAILDQANALRRLRHRALVRLNTLEQAIFSTTQALTAKTAEQFYIRDLCDLVRGSSPRPQGDPRFFGGPVPRLMIADITRDGMEVTPLIDSLTVEGAKKSRPMAAGDVVMAVSGAVGLPAILKVDACIHDGFVGFRQLDKKVRPEYLYHILLSQMENNKARGTGAIWSNLTTDYVKNIQIKVPTLAEQDTILTQVRAISSQKRLAMHHADALDRLFTSLQHRAFRGEL